MLTNRSPIRIYSKQAYEQGIAAKNAGDIDVALRYFNLAIGNDTNYWAAHYECYKIYLAKQKWTEAFESYHKLVSARQDALFTADDFYQLAIAYKMLYVFSPLSITALTGVNHFLDKALEKDNNYTLAFVLRAKILYARKLYQEAIDDWGRVGETNYSLTDEDSLAKFQAYSRAIHLGELQKAKSIGFSLLNSSLVNNDFSHYKILRGLVRVHLFLAKHQQDFLVKQANFIDGLKYFQIISASSSLQQFVKLKFKNKILAIKKEARGLDFINFGFELIPHKDIHSGQFLGKGGFGLVKKGEWKGKAVALKELTEVDHKNICSFLHEANLQYQQQSDYIVKLFGICVENMKYMMVMELMVNGNLADYLEKPDTISWNVFLVIATDVATGLLDLHQNGIVHRDIKSANILLNSSLRAKVADFGLSVTQEEDRELAVGERMVGTHEYEAPEVFAGINNCPADIYSFGMILYAISARKEPWLEYRGDPVTITRVVRSGYRPPIPLVTQNNSPQQTPVRFSELITSCWSHRPQERPTAEKIVEKLQLINSERASNTP